MSSFQAMKLLNDDLHEPPSENACENGSESRVICRFQVQKLEVLHQVHAHL